MPVFGKKLTGVLGTALQFCPVQKEGFPFPAKGKHGGNEPVAEKRIADTLDIYFCTESLDRVPKLCYYSNS